MSLCSLARTGSSECTPALSPCSQAQPLVGTPGSGAVAAGGHWDIPCPCQLPGPSNCCPTSPRLPSLIPQRQLPPSQPQPTPLLLMPQAMFTALLFWCLQGLLYPQPVGDWMDEATRERMQEREDFLEEQMDLLLQEVEGRTLEQTLMAWGALLWSAVLQAMLWAAAGVLLLLLILGLWFCLGQISLKHKRSSRVWGSSSTSGDSSSSSGESSGSSGESPASSGGSSYSSLRDDEQGEDDLDHLRRLLEEHINWAVLD